MPTAPVVDGIDPATDRGDGLQVILEVAAIVELGLERRPETLLLGIVPTHPGAPHREPHIQFFSNPGHLPNHLSVEQIRYGLSNMRNPLLASHATHLLPYRGLGSGIPRALKAWPSIELVDDCAGNQFRAIIPRPSAGSG